MSQRTKPPFRADHVGWLLRPPALKEARAKHAKGEIDAAALKAVEDARSRRSSRSRKRSACKLATDGEFRRSWWHFDFFKGLQGVDLIEAPPIKFHGVETKSEAIKIDRKVDFAGHPHIEHFKFLKAQLQRRAENDDPGAVDVPFPPGPGDGEQGRLSRTSTNSSPMSPPPGTRRSAPSTTPAAAICSSTTPPGR